MSVRVTDNKLPVGAMYAPFCRTKYVDTSCWEADIKRMSEMGYTCLHGFSEWWRVEQKKGEFDFTQTDLLIELCDKYHIVPIINIATQNGVGYYMPRWMQNEYKGRGVVDCDGNCNVDSQFLTACMDDPWYQTYSQRYLRAVATHYAGDKRIGGWVIWGEPMLTKNGKPICYCEHTVSKFHDWLKKKYEGSIEKLNTIWGSEGPSDYADFNEVNAPTGASGQRGGYASWMDWQSFMTENFANHIKTANRIFKECGATQPTITEMFPHIDGGMCSDAWQLAETSDIVGISNYFRPGHDMATVMVIANSVAERLNKSIFIVEALGGPRYPTGDQRTPTIPEILSETIQTVGANAKGLMYWCFRPRLTDFEGGAYGMSRTDGKPLPRTFAAGKIADDVAKKQDILLQAQRKSEVAIFYSIHITHMAGNSISGGDGVGRQMSDAVNGAIQVMQDAHITPTLVDEKMIQAGLADHFKVLILPFAYAMDEETIDGICRFAKKGGCVIADHHLAFKRLNGEIYRLAPGENLKELFGVEREDILLVEHPSMLPEDNHYEMRNLSAWDVLLPTTATVVEEARNIPLITRNSYGDGEGWYFAWQAFANYRVSQGIPSLRNFAKKLLAERNVVPFVSLPEQDQLPRADIVTSELSLPDGRQILTFINPSFDSIQFTAQLEGKKKAEVLLGSADIHCEQNKNTLQLTIGFSAWQSVMFICE